MKFEILYYVIGILYLIFDLEIIFLFPAAIACVVSLNLIAFWVVMVFVIILTIRLYYFKNCVSRSLIWLSLLR